LAANIKSRRGGGIIINVPIFQDVKTAPSVREFSNFPAAQPNCIYMDALFFGHGCCALQVTLHIHLYYLITILHLYFLLTYYFTLVLTCIYCTYYFTLQVTVQAFDADEAAYLYDQFLALCPILIALR
jgi:hypothetical protein